MSNRNKVIILSYDMIPYANTWGGCQRMYFLAEFLINNGFDVTVYSSFKGNENFYGKEINFNQSIGYPRSNLLKKFLISKNHNLTESSNYKVQNHSIFQKITKLIKNNKLLFFILKFFDKLIYNEPGILNGALVRSWLKNIKKDLIKDIFKNDIKNVIISGPPFGIFSIAKSIRKIDNDIRVIFDYRDPWNLWNDNNFFTRIIENMYLKNADKIVCTNTPLIEAMKKEFQIKSDKLIKIENGYSSDSWKHIDLKHIKGEFMIISYVGVIDLYENLEEGYRDISIFLKALKMQIDQGKKIIFQIVGVINPNTDYAKKIKRDFGDNVKYVGVVDNIESNKLMCLSDILLLNHTTHDKSSKYIISGKYYDYIRANRPIFSIGAPNGLHSELIKKYNLGLSCDNNINEIFNCLGIFYEKWEYNNLFVKFANITSFSRESQYKKFLQIIKR